MKKIFAIAVAVIMIVTVMCTPAFALSGNEKLNVQIFAQDTATWAWVSGGSYEVALGESADLTWSGFDFSAVDTSADINFGMQIDDMLAQDNGYTSVVNVTVSNIVMKANGYDDITVNVAGTADHNIGPVVVESWGPSVHCFDFNSDIKGAVQAVVGTDTQALYDYINALTEITMSITYNAYNGEAVEGAAAPAEEEAPAAEETPAEAPAAEEAPVAEPAPAPAPAAPATGLALAVVPAVMALAAVAVSKKH